MANRKKTAIVTGSSQGIGAVLALRLAAEGYQLVVNYPDAEHRAGAEQVTGAITAAGGRPLRFAPMWRLRRLSNGCSILPRQPMARWT